MNDQENVGLQMGSVPLGTILAFALQTNNIPKGWLLCNGEVIPTTSPLSNFMSNTPNLCGRTLIGTGAPTYPAPIQSDGLSPNFDQSNNWPLGYTGGEYKHLLTVDEIPAHNHGYSYSNPTGGNGLYGGSYWGPTTVDGSTSSVGGSQMHYNMQPYYAVNYIIYAG